MHLIAAALTSCGETALKPPFVGAEFVDPYESDTWQLKEKI